MTSKENSDLVWCGRKHLGDQPGLYGNAEYVGLTFELPIELELMPDAPSINHEVHIAVYLECRNVTAPTGHIVTLNEFLPTDDSMKTWHKKLISRIDFSATHSESAILTIRGKIPRFVTAKIEVDTSVPPGLFDDIVVTRIETRSRSHCGYLGYRHLDLSASELPNAVSRSSSQEISTAR